MRAIIAAAILAASAGSASSYRPPDIDTALVLVADVSLSMDEQERDFQRKAYAEAFRSREVIDAIERGAVGCIGVTLVYFAERQHQTVEWAKVCNTAQAHAFALAIQEAEIPNLGTMTATGNAMQAAFEIIKAAPYYAPPLETRRIIDVSADGTSNAGIPPAPVRDEIAKAGVTVNGLPIVIAPGEKARILVDHFNSFIIAGPSHFLEPVYGLGDLPRALRRKLVLEIAGVL